MDPTQLTWAGSALTMGLVHSLIPSHWLPVVMVASRLGWSPATAMLGGLAASLGHVLVSGGLAWAVLSMGFEHGEELEHWGSIILILFGLTYGWIEYGRNKPHHHTLGEGLRDAQPMAYFFVMGLSPCVAFLPLLGASSLEGHVVLTTVSFLAGVVVALLALTYVGVSAMDRVLEQAKKGRRNWDRMGGLITATIIVVLGLTSLLMHNHHEH